METILHIVFLRMIMRLNSSVLVIFCSESKFRITRTAAGRSSDSTESSDRANFYEKKKKKKNCKVETILKLIYKVQTFF